MADYTSFSYPLLIVLLVGGVVVLFVHIVRQRRFRKGLSGQYLVFAGMLIFLSLGGGFLKVMGGHRKKQDDDARIQQQEQQRLAFLSKHRAPTGCPPGRSRPRRSSN